MEACGSELVARIVSGAEFRQTGIAYGGDSSAALAVVDPRAHPLGVWQKRTCGLASYRDAAVAMEPALFTNGPMMGKRLSPRSKLTRRRVAWEFAAGAGAGAIAGLELGRTRRRGYALGAVGAAFGSLRAWRRSFTEWAPCGHAVSAARGIRQLSSFDGESSRHSWFGRFGTDFRSYAVGHGDLPVNVVEGLGGLILLVDRFAPVDASGSGAGSDFAALAHKRGIVAWGLVPLQVRATPELAGVIVVLGSRHALDAATASGVLARLGAREAVGMDQSGCVMMGARRSVLVGPPPLHRQAMQTYGLFCV